MASPGKRKRKKMFGNYAGESTTPETKVVEAPAAPPPTPQKAPKPKKTKKWFSKEKSEE